MNDSFAHQEELREELIDGKVVAMSPRPIVNHHRIAFRIAYLFENYLEGRKCTPFSDGADLHLTEKDIFLPDMMVVCDQEKIKTDGVYGAPDLVVEVLSPSTAKRDRGYKKDTYAKCGVREYWLVSPAENSVDIASEFIADFPNLWYSSSVFHRESIRIFTPALFTSRMTDKNDKEESALPQNRI